MSKRKLAEAADLTAGALEVALRDLTASLPLPALVHTVSGRPAYRYNERTAQQAILLKLVRLASATTAARILLNAGLVMDVGASMRVMDEVGAEIKFLAGPILFKTDFEDQHHRFIAELFQEEFDHSDVVQSTQKRDRVSRKRVRAYNARTYNVGAPISQVIAVNETIDSMLSGFIHGAGVHILDVFDGDRFRYMMKPGDDPLEAMVEQYPLYLHRALMDAHLAALALAHTKRAQALYSLITEIFDEDGRIR